MPKIQLEIGSCIECPFFVTTSSYDIYKKCIVTRGVCTAIYPSKLVDQRETSTVAPPVPDWCPIIVKEN